MGETTKEHLKELLASFDTAMLITRDGDQDHARPMALAGVEGASTLWFVTSQWSPKAGEIAQDQRVSLTFQASKKFIALSGMAQLVKDQAKLEELWKAEWKVWFPDGKDDPKISLIRVNVTDAEFWDNSGAQGIKYAFASAKAVLTGTTPDPVPGVHGRIQANGNMPGSQRH